MLMGKRGGGGRRGGLGPFQNIAHHRFSLSLSLSPPPHTHSHSDQLTLVVKIKLAGFSLLSPSHGSGASAQLYDSCIDR